MSSIVMTRVMRAHSKQYAHTIVDVYQYSYCHCLLLHPIYYLRPPCLWALLVVTQIRGHVVGSFLPSPLRSYIWYLAFYREKNSAVVSNLFPRRIASNCRAYSTHAVITGALDAAEYVRQQQSTNQSGSRFVACTEPTLSLIHI